MLDILKAVILGIVEGLTEFLPISSTGHLIIINQWITFGESFTKTFDIVIQLGAILSVVVYFWDRLFPFGAGKTPEKQREIFHLWALTVVGVLPAVVLGVLLDDFIESRLFNPVVVAVMLVIGGIVFIVVERTERNSRVLKVTDLTYRTAFFIGIIQCLAMIPGTSRSAATIIGAMFLGATRVVAAEYSFFLAIPTMVGATAYSLLTADIIFSGREYMILAVGFVVSFIVAWFVIKRFLSYVSSHTFMPFAYYRIVLGVLVLGYSLMF